jgi:protein involved in polysaccharide export with SLBB domain
MHFNRLHMSAILAALLSVFSLAGCAATQPLATSPTVAEFSPQEYRLTPGDKVQITVFNEPSLSGIVEISNDGLIDLQLIGQVEAINKTTAELAKAIVQRYSTGFLINPIVTAQVTTYRPFSVLGEVNRPGNFAYVPGLTASGAIAAAEGFTYRAQTKTIFIKRRGEPQEQAYRWTSDLPVMPGDTIRVGERHI